MQQKTRWMAICLAVGLCTGPVGATMITSLQSGQTWSGNIVAGSEVDPSLTNSSPWNNGGFVFNSPNGNISYSSIGGTTVGLTTNGGEIDIATPAGGESAMYLSFGIYNTSGNFPDHGGSLTVVLSDSESFAVGYGPFWFSNSARITSVKVSSTNTSDEPFVLQLAYATSSLPPDNGNPGGTSPIPEPATILLASAGALILFGARRRWFRRAE